LHLFHSSRGVVPHRRLLDHAAILGAVTAAALALLAPPVVRAQTFVEVTDPMNPIVSDNGVNPGAYSGASWIDYNRDGRLDLFVVRRNVYKNDGGGVFTKLNPGVAAQGSAFGSSWADTDNDGDEDLFVSAGTTGSISKGSFFYVDQGGDVFTKTATGALGDSLDNSGWGSAWCDYDNDGRLDLVIAAPFNFAGITHLNRLYHNDGGNAFTRVTTTDVTDTTGPYTVPTWSDFDDDGDFDLFIGSGPANGTVAPDYIFRNTLIEDGAADLVRITTGALATDARDGQNFNLIDYDNDADLDAYVTNYGAAFGGLANDLYRNDGGTFVKMTGGDAGAIVTDADISLANLWADFDNDADLDCFVTNDGADSCRYYRNDGGVFTAIRTGAHVTEPGPHYGAAAGDYDDDGDVDLFVQGIATGKSLFRNDLGGGNAWVKVQCEGTISNRSAIGTKLRAIATIGGVRVEQRRDISAQDSFNGHNSWIVHFGLLDAQVVDSLVVTWPRGLVEIYAGLATRQTHQIVEGASVVGVEMAPDAAAAVLAPCAPNPFATATSIDFRLSRSGRARLDVFDASGRRVATLIDENLGAGSHRARFEPLAAQPSGIYVYRLVAAGRTLTGRMTLIS
jgi:hypothetical protein